MADALCGPSNALQNFQKHSQADRTLQQDRLVSRPGPSQGFRSATPNAGVLDPEFEAFQAGVPVGPPQLQPERLPYFPPSHISQQHAQPAPSLGGWASDFQRLHISASRPSSAHQVLPSAVARQGPVVQQRPAASTSWQTDFLQSNGMSTFQPHQPLQMDYSWAPGPQTYIQSAPMEIHKERIADDPLDMAAFEKAFDAARAELLEAEAETQAEAERQAEEADTTLDSDLAELQEETNHLAAQERSLMANWSQELAEAQAPFEISESYLPDARPDEFSEYTEPLPEEKRAIPPDQDELSQVAGQLLDSVSHDTSEKFQSSVFLELMRRLRDKEVHVEGENFVETGTSSPVPLEPKWIPPEEQDLDTGRYAVDTTLPLPSRPLTPEIDPPAPTLEQWRRRLLGVEVPTWVPT